jgi:hypothetical protein
MNTRDSVKWEVIFCHLEITVDNWHFNVAPFTKQWTHLKPHEAFCQVIYHINPHFLKLNPHSHRVNPAWIPVFRSVTFTGWRIPLFLFWNVYFWQLSGVSRPSVTNSTPVICGLSPHGARWETSSATGAQAQHWGDWALSPIPLVPPLRLVAGAALKVMTWADR